jgi:hypothetical protein
MRFSPLTLLATTACASTLTKRCSPMRNPELALGY